MNSLKPVYLWQAFERLGSEAHDFRRRILPRLVQSTDNAFAAWDHASTILATHAHDLARATACRPPLTLDGGSPNINELAAELDEAVAMVRETLDSSPRNHLLRPALEYDIDESCTPLSGGEWRLHAMLMPLDSATLLERARELAIALAIGNGAGHSADEIRVAITTLPHRSLLRRFRAFTFDKFLYHAETLLRLAPTIHDSVFRVPTGRFGPSSVLMPAESPLVTGPVSYLLTCLMEIRANNHFGTVWRVAVRPEIKRGSWHCFAAPRIFDILYQKWLTLSRNASDVRQRVPDQSEGVLP